MTLRMNRAAYPISSLGYGKRIGLWLQGCTIRCPECASKDTWPNEGGILVDIELLANEVARLAIDSNLDGLTITGGEPSDQSYNVARLIGHIKSLLSEASNQLFDVLIFSGRNEACIRRSYRELWDASDTLISGPYDAELPSNQWLVASANQKVTFRTELGRARYQSGAAKCEKPNLQFTMHNGGVAFAGITKSGDLERLTNALKSQGITLGGCSWNNA